MVKVSVIIPVYNAQDYLGKCLDTVCGQTLQDIEIICINDCSRDDSDAILQAYAKDDARIKLINLDENKGAAVARNIAIDAACGQYIGFVDADDFIDLEFYEALYEKAIDCNAQVVKGNFKTYCPKTHVAKKEAWVDLNAKVKLHKAHFYLTFTSAIYDRAFVKGNDIHFLEGLVNFEDPYFTIKAALFYDKIEVVDDVCYYYVDNPNSSSRYNVGMKHVDALRLGVERTLDLLDEHYVKKEHYVIVFNFLVEHVLNWCNRIYVSDEITKKAVALILLLAQRCHYSRECLMDYFVQKKKDQRQEIARNLRNNFKKKVNYA